MVVVGAVVVRRSIVGRRPTRLVSSPRPLPSSPPLSTPSPSQLVVVAVSSIDKIFSFFATTGKAAASGGIGAVCRSAMACVGKPAVNPLFVNVVLCGSEISERIGGGCVRLGGVCTPNIRSSLCAALLPTNNPCLLFRIVFNSIASLVPPPTTSHRACTHTHTYAPTHPQA